MPVPLLIHVNEENRGGWVQVRFDNIKWKKKRENENVTYKEVLNLIYNQGHSQ